MSKQYRLDVRGEPIFRQNLYDVMKNVYKERKKYLSQSMQELPDVEQVKELGKHVLVIAVQYFSKIIDSNQAHQPQEDNTVRADSPLKAETNHTTTSAAKSGVKKDSDSARNAEPQDINKEYERLAAERKVVLQGLQESSAETGGTIARVPTQSHVNSLNRQIRTINEQAAPQSRSDPVPTSVGFAEKDNTSVFEGLEDPSSADLSSQFNVLSQNDSLVALEKQFEGGSIQERLKQFEQERAAPIQVTLKDQSSANTVRSVAPQDTSAFVAPETSEGTEAAQQVEDEKTSKVELHRPKAASIMS